jgi:hypothetical protein
MSICFYQAIHFYGMSKSDNLKCTPAILLNFAEAKKYVSLQRLAAGATSRACY